MSTANGEDDTIAVAVDGVIRLTAPPAMTESGRSVSIDGTGFSVPNDLPVAVSGGNAVQVFTTAPGVTAGFDNLTVQNGRGENGGGVVNAGTLTVTNCYVISNSATVRRGGVRNRGTLTVTDSTIVGNAAVGSDEGLDNGGRGGGVFNSGTLTLTRTDVRQNSADLQGGGIDNNFDGFLTVAVGTFFGNSGGVVGGAVYSDVNAGGCRWRSPTPRSPTTPACTAGPSSTSARPG